MGEGFDFNQKRKEVTKKLKNKFSILRANNVGLILALSIVAIDIGCILFAAALLKFLPENEGRSFFETIRFAFTLMVNPSGRYVYSDYPISLIVTTSVVLIGMISLTAGTVGYITSFINGILDKSKTSGAKLGIADHVVILNYNSMVPYILYDYCYDDASNTYVVILSDVSTDVVEKDIEQMYNNKSVKKKFMNVVIREGNPMSKLDLDNISLIDAKSVIIAVPESQENVDSKELEFEGARQFMFIENYCKDVDKRPDVVLEVFDGNLRKLVRNYQDTQKERHIIHANYNELLGKSLALTALTPSLYDGLKQLFSFEGVELYLEKKNPLNTKTFETQLKATKSAIPVYDTSDGYRVYIAEDDSELSEKNLNFNDSYNMSIAPEKIDFNPSAVLDKDIVIILGVSSRLEYVLDSLNSFAKAYGNGGFGVTLADTSEHLSDIMKYADAQKYPYIFNEGHAKYLLIDDIYNPYANLSFMFNSNKKISILALSDEKEPVSLKDSKPLLYWSGLKAVVQSNDNINFTAEIQNPQNANIFAGEKNCQVIDSISYMGGVFANLGKNIRRLFVIRALINHDEVMDKDNVALDFEEKDTMDILDIPVTKLMSISGNRIFNSKRELINWIYENTSHELIPVAIIKDGKTYFFSRIENAEESLDDSILYEKSSNGLNGGRVIVQPEDSLIVIRNYK